MIRLTQFPRLFLACILSVLSLATVAQSTAKQWISYTGREGAGKGKNIVLISGEEEYRSEESFPMLARILSERYGFNTTVLFSQDPATGEINPDMQTNIPGMQHLQKADLIIICMRFRELPDAQMRYFDEYLKSGKPIVALRTSTHAFQYSRNKTGRYAKYDWQSKAPGWKQGFGRTVLGETWVAHHGDHGVEGTRALVNGLQENHPALKGVKDVWGFTDVYTVSSLDARSTVLLYGLSTQALDPASPPNYNKSIMPIAWTRDYVGEAGKHSRIFTTTLGSSVDLQNEDLRRMIVNASFWGLGMENKIADKANVDPVGNYQPIMFGFGKYKKGMKPADYE